jgi:hypothetical protein
MSDRSPLPQGGLYRAPRTVTVVLFSSAPLGAALGSPFLQRRHHGSHLVHLSRTAICGFVLARPSSTERSKKKNVSSSRGWESLWETIPSPRQMEHPRKELCTEGREPSWQERRKKLHHWRMCQCQGARNPDGGGMRWAAGAWTKFGFCFWKRQHTAVGKNHEVWGRGHS